MLKYKCGAAGAARAVRARSGGASPAARHVATSLHAAALHPPAPYPRTPDYTFEMRVSTSPKSSAKSPKSPKPPTISRRYFTDEE